MSDFIFLQYKMCSQYLAQVDLLKGQCKQHFTEEEVELLPLMEALELSKEQEVSALKQCFEVMQGTHGLSPRDAMKYLDLINKCRDKEKMKLNKFGAVGDEVILNTKSFQNAIFYLNSFADKGGAKLFVPVNRWLIGSFDLISHLTFWLDKDVWSIFVNNCHAMQGLIDEFNRGSHFKFNLLEFSILDNSSCILQCGIKPL
ncbi:putative polygalacturonase, partial [Mucuna pruriens]